jgi:hypothetical protein
MQVPSGRNTSNKTKERAKYIPEILQKSETFFGGKFVHSLIVCHLSPPAPTAIAVDDDVDY